MDLSLPNLTNSRHRISLQLLQKYIAYARTHVSPVLSDEAAEVLRSFYLQLRRQASLIDGAPVTVKPWNPDVGRNPNITRNMEGVQYSIPYPSRGCIHSMFMPPFCYVALGDMITYFTRCP